MDSFLSDLVTWLQYLFNLIKNLLIWFADVIFNLIHSAVNFCWDSLCTFILWIVSITDFHANYFTSAFSWAGLPAQQVYILSAVGLDSCLNMLSVALLIRVGLNFIPGWITRL